MTADNPQVPWTDEQWARVNQVIQEEASRVRVAATFLPLYGPLSADTDFVRKELINDDPPPPISIADRDIIQLATLQVKVELRGAQMADPEMRSVLALFRRAANVLARLEDAIVFRGQPGGGRPPEGGAPPKIWEISGGGENRGLLDDDNDEQGPITDGESLVAGVSAAIGTLEGKGHFGPFAVVLDREFFNIAQRPGDGSYVLPQDRIVPFLGGGPLLRSSTLPTSSGLVVALGGAPIELVVAADMSVQFLQVTEKPRFLFRVREKIALRTKQPTAIITLTDEEPEGPQPSQKQKPNRAAAARAMTRRGGSSSARRRRRPHEPKE